MNHDVALMGLIMPVRVGVGLGGIDAVNCRVELCGAVMVEQTEVAYLLIQLADDKPTLQK